MSVQKIGRYEIDRELGRGGMAVVYLARDPYMKRQVAVKVLPRQFTHDPQFRARFQREAEIIAALEHPHIVPVHDYGEHEDQPFIVMRYMTGGSLADRLKGGPMSLAEAVRVFTPLAAALDQAHAQNIVHRDLKPGNILFDAHGEPYISDFGIAKLLAETGTTFTGSAIIGTPAYMSPEQARGERDIDGRSDIYAMGGMLFEMLTGRPPYEADTPMGLALKHLTEPVPRLLDARPDLPPGCGDAISRAMAKNREDRYRVANDLALAVGKALKGDAAVQPESISEVVTLAQKKRPVAAANQRESHFLSESSGQRVRLRRLRLNREIAYMFVLLVTGIGCLATYFVGSREGVIGGVATSLASRRAAVVPTFVFTVVAPTTAPAPTSASPPTATPAPSVTPTYGIGSTLVSTVDGTILSYVPAGEFIMGSSEADANAEGNERPQRTAHLGAFWIDQTEVTNQAYAACVVAGGCKRPYRPDSATRVGYYDDLQYAHYPIINVSWEDAKSYCSWSGRRLPSEAEWEKAARGLDGKMYPWGDIQPTVDLLNFNNQIGDTTQVGYFPKGVSPFGVLDMAGNVWEWVADWYMYEYYSVSPLENPLGPPTGEGHVIRGGSWNYGAEYARSSYRGWSPAVNRLDHLGFRCALSP